MSLLLAVPVTTLSDPVCTDAIQRPSRTTAPTQREAPPLGKMGDVITGPRHVTLAAPDEEENSSQKLRARDWGIRRLRDKRPPVRALLTTSGRPRIVC